MSRSGYSESCNEDPLSYGRWRAQVASAIRGKRGQRFFADLIAALDALPEHRLIANDLQNAEGAVCALGALGKARGVDMSPIDTEDYDQLGATFNVAHQLAQETMWINDEGGAGRRTTPEERWAMVRAWAIRQLAAPKVAPATGSGA